MRIRHFMYHILLAKFEDGGMHWRPADVIQRESGDRASCPFTKMDVYGLHELELIGKEVSKIEKCLSETTA